jgi:hypothetical protein
MQRTKKNPAKTIANLDSNNTSQKPFVASCLPQLAEWRKNSHKPPYNMPRSLDSKWVINYLDVRGKAEDVARFKETAVGRNPLVWGENRQDILSIDNFMPIPKKLLNPKYIEQRVLWETARWGCSYVDKSTELIGYKPGQICYTFVTGITPPIYFYLELVETWPMLKFKLSYTIISLLMYRELHWSVNR